MPRDPRTETTQVIHKDAFGNAYMADLVDDLKDAALVPNGPCEPLRNAVMNAALALEYGTPPSRVAKTLRLAVKAYDARNTKR